MQPGEGDRVEPSNGSNPEPSAPTLGVLLEVDGSIPTAILLNPADLDDNDVDPDVDEDPVVDDGPIDVDKGDLSDDDDVPVKFMGFGFKGGPLSTTELLNKMTGRAVGRPATTATRAPPPPPQPVTATTARAFTPAAPAPVQPATSAPTANRAPNNNSKPLAQLPRSSDGATVGPEDEVRAGTGEGGEPSEASGVVVDNQGDASGGEDDSDTGEEGLSDIDSEDEEPVQMMEVVVGGNRRGPRR